jgi:uncharacterized protein with HEPN domain
VSIEKEKASIENLLVFLQEAIDRIKEDVSDVSHKDFVEGPDNKSIRQIRDAVVLNIGNLGEISNDIRIHHPGFAVANPGLPLDKASDMRNMLFHGGYHAVDYGIVWAVAKKAIPDFEAQLNSVREQLGLTSACAKCNTTPCICGGGLGGGPR